MRFLPAAARRLFGRTDRGAEEIVDAFHGPDRKAHTVQLGRDQAEGAFAVPRRIGAIDAMPAPALSVRLGQRAQNAGIRPELNMPDRNAGFVGELAGADFVQGVETSAAGLYRTINRV